MSYFIYKGTIQPGRTFFITGKEAKHIIQSRRITPGEVILIQDSANNRFETRVLEIDDGTIKLNPLNQQQVGETSNYRIHLFQALIKEKALDFVIQKTTELGVSSITVFHSRFSQRLKPVSIIEKKLTRWNRIALEACKQSGRLTPPTIFFVPNLQKSDQFLPDSSIESCPTICLTSAGDAVPLNRIEPAGSCIALLIGPEGGWHESELEGFDCRRVHLGPRILRSETAAVSAVGLAQFLFGDMQEISEET